MIKVALVRHSKTLGNIKKRYIGITDEPICEEGIELLKDFIYFDVDVVYSSPLKRCIQTAQIIYPDKDKIIIEDLKECNFGEFENKNFMELSDNKAYQDWIDSGGKEKFPGGEEVSLFKKRCTDAFKGIINESVSKNHDTVGIVAHGGTIMSIMDEFAFPKKDYYAWHVDNADGFLIDVDKINWRITAKCYIR